MAGINMVRTGALLAVLLACCALASGAAVRAGGGCGEWEFACGSGECVDVGARCDGPVDCSDGSDESDDTCKAGAAALSLGEKAEVSFVYSEDFGAVWLLSCSDVACSRLYVDGSVPDGTLSYEVGIRCNAKGFDCTADSSNKPSGAKEFEDGVVQTLVVERTAGHLVVSLPGHSDESVTVQIEESYSQLSLRPDLWKGDLTVQIKVISAQASTPAQESSTPAQESSTPAQESSTPAQESSTPAQESSTPAQESSTPAQESSTPVQESSTPAQESSTPAQESSTPAQESSTPAQESSTPAQESSTASTPEPSSPASESTPVEATTPESTSEDSLPSTAAPWPPVPAPSSCSPEEASLLIPVAGECGQYTVCYSGRSQLMRCPSILLFNYQLQTCDWPRNVECGSA